MLPFSMIVRYYEIEDEQMIKRKMKKNIRIEKFQKKYLDVWVESMINICNKLVTKEDRTFNTTIMQHMRNILKKGWKNVVSFDK